MKSLRIALLQISPCGDTDKNLQKGLAACRAARAQGADIALFPEMWSNGYNLYGRPVDAWKAEAIPGDGAFVHSFGALARELDMAVGVTLLERYDGGPRNTLVLFDRHGERKLTYAKVHTCDFDVERSLTPGDGFSVVSLDTACGAVHVGAMICYDREFPESARLLMLQGAELILVPNACPMKSTVWRSFAPAPTKTCSPSPPAIIRPPYPTATAIPPFSTAWLICPSCPARGIPVFCRRTKTRAFMLQI